MSNAVVTASSSSGKAPLDAIISNEQLRQRPCSAPNYERENRVLLNLMQAMPDPSRNIQQELSQAALELCDAQSAGVSILEEDRGVPIFRWRGVSGRWSGIVGGMIPRELCPCGEVLNRNCALLMTIPQRYYVALQTMIPPVVEALLVPIRAGNENVGVIWIVSHNEQRRFDREDERVLNSLARFAEVMYQLNVAKLGPRKSGLLTRQS